jgi:acyl-CoA synthetase (AMP-forming)/AMP-acid ligase II
MLLDEEFAAKPGSVGRPLPCMEARVVDERGVATAAGVPGELLLRGSLVTTGYPEPAELRCWVRHRLADYAAPRWVHVDTELPHNATGKVLKPELRRQAAELAGRTHQSDA